MKKKYKSIIGLSGGLDSSMTAWLVCNKEEYLHKFASIKLGEKPLAVIVDNHWNTDIANSNIMRIVNHFQLDYLWIKVDKEQFFDLQRAFLKSGTKNIEIPTDHIIYALTYKIADMVGAKVIYSGGNTATEGYMPKEWGYNARDLTFIKAIHKRFGTGLMDRIPTLSLLGYIYHRFIKRIKIVQPLEEIDYRVKESKELLNREINWEDYGEKHEESIYTKWFQNCYLPQKFGIDKREAHYQSLVNSGQMTKEEMLEKLKKQPVCIDLNDLTIDFTNRVVEGIDCWLKTPKKSYKDYQNNEQLVNLLSYIFKIWKRITSVV